MKKGDRGRRSKRERKKKVQNYNERGGPLSSLLPCPSQHPQKHRGTHKTRLCLNLPNVSLVVHNCVLSNNTSCFMCHPFQGYSRGRRSCFARHRREKVCPPLSWEWESHRQCLPLGLMGMRKPHLLLNWDEIGRKAGYVPLMGLDGSLT